MFCLTTDPKNLFDDMIGIYCVGTNGITGAGGPGLANYNQDWSRPTNIELIDTDGTTKLNQSIDVEISGAASRIKDQKSLKIKANKRHGVNRLDYPFFKTKEGQRYKSIVLRNSGQDFGKTQLLDAYEQAIIADHLNLDYIAYTPSVHYINGEYYGLINMRERSNDDYIYSIKGLDSDSIELLEYRFQLLSSVGTKDAFQTLYNYITTNDLSQESVFEQVAAQMDIESYINYMAVQLYVCNGDWPTNNNKFYRKTNGGKWRWILQDLDAGSFHVGTKYLDLLATKLLDKKLTDMPSIMFRSLIKNESFKNRFIDQWCVIIGSLYGPERTIAILDSMVLKIKPELQYHYDRWNIQNEFDKYIENCKSFARERPAYVYGQIEKNFELGTLKTLKVGSNAKNAKLKFNTLSIPVLPYNGSYFMNSSVVLDAEEYANNKKFKCWEIVRSGVKSTTSERTISFVLSGDEEYTAIYEINKGDYHSGLTINEINATAKIYAEETAFKQEDWIELYNASAYPISLSGYYISNDKENLQMYRIPEVSDASTVILPNDYKIIWADKSPERGALHCNFKLPAEGGTILLSKNENEGLMLVDEVTYCTHSELTTFGRYPDGGANLYVLDIPTFKKANLNSSYDEFRYTQDHFYKQPLGVAKKELLNVSVYPNPVKETLYVTYDNDYLTHVTVYDKMGRVFYNKSLQNENRTIDVSQWPIDIYVLRVENELGQFHFKFSKE